MFSLPCLFAGRPSLRLPKSSRILVDIRDGHIGKGSASIIFSYVAGPASGQAGKQCR